MLRAPAAPSLSPLTEIESVDGRVRRVLAALKAHRDAATLQSLCELSQLLDTLGNASLERRIAGYLAGIPQLVHLLLRKHGIPDKFAVVSGPCVTGQPDLKASAQAVTAYEGLTIVDTGTVADCAAAAYEAQRRLGLGSVRFWGSRGTRLALLIIQAAASKDDEAMFVAGECGLRLRLYSAPTSIPEHNANPYRLTLVTSLFKGKKYIPSFIENLALSSRFGETCLMIFDAGASHEDLEVLAPYLTKYRNIKYMALARDPGLYDIWNLGVHLSTTPYIGNANLDDRRHPLLLDALLNELDSAPDVMLTSSHVVPMTDYEADYGTYLPIAPHVYFSWMKGPYSITDMFRTTDEGGIESHCIPHCMPVWRRELHDRCGYFCEPRYRSAADYELWLRGMAAGLKYSLVDVPASYYYINPNSYMRVDATHGNVGQEMHDRYIGGLAPTASAYTPDFLTLRGLIQLTVN